MAAAILDRVHERGRFIHLDGPSGRTRHLNPEETLPENTKRLRISGIGGSEFPEPTSDKNCQDSLPISRNKVFPRPVVHLRCYRTYRYCILATKAQWVCGEPRSQSQLTPLCIRGIAQSLHGIRICRVDKTCVVS